jgi:type IV secretory pathway TraG/TraD family ATPase VirD4
MTITKEEVILMIRRQEVYVGETPEGNPIALRDNVRCGQVQIVGATGRGKTESVVIPWLIQDIIQNKVTILMDAKGDQSILKRIDRVYRDHRVKREGLVWFDLSDVEGSFKTNPLKYGTAQQITDRIFSTFNFENLYFKSVAYEATLLVVEVIQSKTTKTEVTFEKVYDALTDDENLTELISSATEGLQRRCLKYLNEPFRARQEKLSGLVSQLQTFAKGELAPLLNGGNEKVFSLSETLVPGLTANVTPMTVAIFIPTLLYQETAAAIGKMFLQEIAWAVALREKRDFKYFTSIFLDEFSSFVYPGFISLLNKARSTGCALHLSHQSLGDLEAVSPEFAKAVHSNTNVKCVFGVNDPDTADFFAKHFGTKDTERTTERVNRKSFGDLEKTGMMSLRQAEIYKIHPNRLREYSQGMGVISLVYQGRAITEEIQFARSPI